MASVLVSVGAARFRVGDWQGSAGVAHVVPLTAAATLVPTALAALRSRLQAHGYRAIVTAAVAPSERDRLMSDGFQVRAELVALSTDLLTSVRLSRSHRRSGLRRGSRRDIDEVLQVDAAAFPPFWRLDAYGLHEARTATPSSRWRVLRAPGVTAYSVTGRAGSRGYLQRLAVAPSWQGQGLGTLLVADSLDWLRRRGVQTVLVNTPPDNERALALYRRCGFAVESDRLAVLQRDLP